jgi:hypothetical protein
MAGTTPGHGRLVGVDVEQRTCRKCGEVKPLSEFARDRTQKSGYRFRCKPCGAVDQAERRAAEPDKWRAYHRDRYHRNPQPARAYAKTYAAENKERRRDTALRNLYGISAAKFDAMSEAQGGVCAICGGVGQRGLVTDHCHDSGEVRGLLCDRCNLNLGQFERMGVEQILRYLKR